MDARQVRAVYLHARDDKGEILLPETVTGDQAFLEEEREFWRIRREMGMPEAMIAAEWYPVMQQHIGKFLGMGMRS